MAEDGGDRAADRTVAELIEQAAEQTARLVREEVALVREELVGDVAKAGTGMALLGGAGALAAYGTGAIVAAAVSALATRMPTWAAAAAVGGGMVCAGGLLAVAGRHEIRQAFPLLPVRSAARAKTDVRRIVRDVAR